MLRSFPILIILFISQAHADHQYYVLEIENDSIAHTDRYYSHGLRFTLIRPIESENALQRKLARAIPLFHGEGDMSTAYAIGQNVYTPRNKRLSVPDPDDRPYAGWLYATVGIDEQLDRGLDRAQLTFGVVGPASLAEEVQRQFHNARDRPLPQGWDNQLGNEITLMLSFERQWRALISTPANYKWGVDVTPHAGGSVGTPFTFINTGFMLRAGWDMPLDYGPPRIQPGLPGSGLFNPTKGLHWYTFAGVDLRAVALDLFLDGSTWRDSPSVDKKSFVGDLHVGFVVGFDHVRISYTHVVRSKEFKTQGESHNFGAFSISWAH